MLPAVVLALGVLAWDLVVRVNALPPYILPGPGLVLSTLVADWPILWTSLLATLETTLAGLALARRRRRRPRHRCSTSRG